MPERKSPVLEHIWDQLPGESKRAFAWFSIYRNMPERSIERIATENSLSPGNLQQAASRWHWTDRVKAYDFFLTITDPAEFPADEKERTRALLDKSYFLLWKAQKRVEALLDAEDSAIKLAELASAIKSIGELIDRLTGGKKTGFSIFHIENIQALITENSDVLAKLGFKPDEIIAASKDAKQILEAVNA